jgi:hypothetical protein
LTGWQTPPKAVAQKRLATGATPLQSGRCFTELIRGDFGDGIMSAIDFFMDIVRQSDPPGRQHERCAIRQVFALQTILI